MSSTNVQKIKATCPKEPPHIHAPVPIKQFGSKILSEFMAVQQEAFVYTINTLLHLGRTLPKLRCNIAKFSAYAFEGEILRYRGKIASPSSFPAVGYRPFADIPSHELSRRDAAGPEKLWNGVKDVPQSELRLRNPRDTKSYEEKTDFVCWVGRVTSPSHNRVTAGGRVVPVIPPPPRPAFANLVTPGSIPFGPSHDNIRQTIVPPRPYVPVPTGWEIVWIEDKAYLAPQQVGIPASHPYPVSPLQPPFNNANYGLQQPLMNVTNAITPQTQQAVISQQIVGQQQPSAASQLQVEQGVWNDYLRAAYFEEQSRQARLRRVNGLAPKAVEPEATRENIKKWNGVLASDGKDFVSASRKVMNYGSPSTKAIREKAEPSRVNYTTNTSKSDQPINGGQHETAGLLRTAVSPVAPIHTAGDGGAEFKEVVENSVQVVAASGGGTSHEADKTADKGNERPKGESKSSPVHNVANGEEAIAVPGKLTKKNLEASGGVNVNSPDAKKALPISERGKAAREAIAIFLQEQLKGRSTGPNKRMQNEMSKSGKATVPPDDNEGTDNLIGATKSSSPTTDGHTFLKGLLQNSRYSTKNSGNASSASKASSSGAVSSACAAGLLPRYHGAMDTFRVVPAPTGIEARLQAHSASSSDGRANGPSKGSIPHMVQETLGRFVHPDLFPHEMLLVRELLTLILKVCPRGLSKLGSAYQPEAMSRMTER
ncbi:MAG: hypothetical protein M1840_004242 [Geoglossum simile]|nr:MAG: hypothetical protein M1840_004242 [Geoglossum simile]